MAESFGATSIHVTVAGGILVQRRAAYLFGARYPLDAPLLRAPESPDTVLARCVPIPLLPIAHARASASPPQTSIDLSRPTLPGGITSSATTAIIGSGFNSNVPAHVGTSDCETWGIHRVRRRGIKYSCNRIEM